MHLLALTLVRVVLTDDDLDGLQAQDATGMLADHYCRNVHALLEPCWRLGEIQLIKDADGEKPRIVLDRCVDLINKPLRDIPMRINPRYVIAEQWSHLNSLDQEYEIRRSGPKS